MCKISSYIRSTPQKIIQDSSNVLLNVVPTHDNQASLYYKAILFIKS